MPAELMQAARVKAAEQGETLKDLVTRAVARELHVPTGTGRAGRLSLPLIGPDSSPGVIVTNADVETALDAENIERYAGQ
jgi:hypothetical protein